MNLGVHQRPAPGDVLRRMQHQHEEDEHLEQVHLVPPPTPPPPPPQGISYIRELYIHRGDLSA